MLCDTSQLFLALRHERFVDNLTVILISKRRGCYEFSLQQAALSASMFLITEIYHKFTLPCIVNE